MLSDTITRVSSRILSLLPDRKASISEIARTTKTTKANTFHTLRSLEKEDIVRKEIKGRTHLYCFNFLHYAAFNLLRLLEVEQKEKYNKKLSNTPILIHSFLAQALKNNYGGCIFFGSSLKEKYQDIDVFIILNEIKNTRELEKKLELINKKTSPLFGTQIELEKGIKVEDMFYLNIINGIAFGVDILSLKYHNYILKKEDIIERFIISYREILTCLEFPDKKYQRIHLEKGRKDLIYTILNYIDISPRNDKEAIDLFRIKLKEKVPRTAKEALALVKKYSYIIKK